MTNMNKTELKEILSKNKILKIISSLIVGIIILLCTIYIFAYSYGYRIRLDKENPIERTGVLSIQSNPSQAKLFLNDEEIGNTPKTVGSILEGNYVVTVEKDGYKKWQKLLPIKSQWSTSFNAFMFLQNPVKENEYSIDNATNYITSPNQKFIFIESLVKPETTNSITEEQKASYSITSYKTSLNFWEFNSAPRTIFTKEIADNISFQIESSEAGNYLLIKEFNTDQATSAINLKTVYLINTQSSLDNKPEELPLTNFLKDYTISWSENERYLILESEQEVLSYDINTKAQTLLTKINSPENKIWKTDKDGFFYVLEKSTLNTEEVSQIEQINIKNNEYFRIQRRSLNGTNPIYLLDNIYFSKGSNSSIGELDLIKNSYFTVSPFSTRFIGEIKEFQIHPESLGIIILTDYGLYWYNTEFAKYALIEIGNITDITFSPDFTTAFFKNNSNDTLNIFTILVEPTDHIRKFGAKMIIHQYSKTSNNYSWLSDSFNIAFPNNNSINLIDYDGENLTEVFAMEKDYSFVFSEDKSFIFLIKKAEKENTVLTEATDETKLTLASESEVESKEITTNEINKVPYVSIEKIRIH